MDQWIRQIEQQVPNGAARDAERDISSPLFDDIQDWTQLNVWGWSGSAEQLEPQKFYGNFPTNYLGNFSPQNFLKLRDGGIILASQIDHDND